VQKFTGERNLIVIRLFEAYCRKQNYIFSWDCKLLRKLERKKKKR